MEDICCSLYTLWFDLTVGGIVIYRVGPLPVFSHWGAKLICVISYMYYSFMLVFGLGPE